MTDSLLSPPSEYPIRRPLRKRSMEDETDTSTETPSSHSSSSSTSSQPILTSTDTISDGDKEAPPSPKNTIKTGQNAAKKMFGRLQSVGKCVGDFCNEFARHSVSYGLAEAGLAAHGYMNPSHFGNPQHGKVRIYDDVPVDREAQELQQALRESLKLMHHGDRQHEGKLERSGGSLKINEGHHSDSKAKTQTKDEARSFAKSERLSEYDEHHIVHIREDGMTRLRGSSSDHIYRFQMLTPPVRQPNWFHKGKGEQDAKHRLKIQKEKEEQDANDFESRVRNNAKAKQEEVPSALQRKTRFQHVFGGFFKKMKASSSHSGGEGSSSPIHQTKTVDHSETPQHPLPLKRSSTPSKYRLAKRAVIPDKVSPQKRGGPVEHAEILRQVQHKSPEMQAQVKKFLNYKYGSKHPGQLPMHEAHTRGAPVHVDEHGLPHVGRGPLPLSPQGHTKLREEREKMMQEHGTSAEEDADLSPELAKSWKALSSKSRREGLSHDPENDPYNVPIPKKEDFNLDEVLRHLDEHLDEVKANGKGHSDHPQIRHQEDNNKKTLPPPPISAANGKPSLQRSASFSGPIRYDDKKRFDPKKYAVYQGPFDKFDKKKKDHSMKGESSKDMFRKEESGSFIDTMQRHKEVK
jgi:hypothetical protein